MKFGFKLNNIQIGDVKIGGVEVNTEFSINEMIAMRKETEHVLANAPTYIRQIADVAVTVMELDRDIEEIDRAQELEDMVNKITHEIKKNSILNMFAQG